MYPEALFEDIWTGTLVGLQNGVHPPSAVL